MIYSCLTYFFQLPQKCAHMIRICPTPKLASWILNSGLRIHVSEPERNIYGSGTTVKTLIK
jgi:hypothetical protein